MSNNKVTVVYDGECPICRTYMQFYRLQDATGQQLELVDARQPSALMDEMTARGLDIDQGMVVIIGDQLYYGSDAQHMLGLLSSRSGFLNRLNYELFRRKALAKVLYPMFKAIRNMLLKVLGVPFIDNLNKPQKQSKPAA